MTDPRELARTHTGVVYSAVGQLLHRLPPTNNVDRDDLIGVGMLALVEAAGRFDEAHEVTFGAYAFRRVQGALLDELRSIDTMDRLARRDAKRLTEVRAQLIQANGTAPTVEELATASGLTAARIREVRTREYRTGTHSVEATNGAEWMPAHEVQPEDAALARARVVELHAAIDRLPDRLRTAVGDYYFGHRTQREIGHKLGVTEARVSQILTESVGKLRRLVAA